MGTISKNHKGKVDEGGWGGRAPWGAKKRIRPVEEQEAGKKKKVKPVETGEFTPGRTPNPELDDV